MEPGTIQMLQRFRSALGLPARILTVPPADPLKLSTRTPGAEDLEASQSEARAAE